MHKGAVLGQVSPPSKPHRQARSVLAEPNAQPPLVPSCASVNRPAPRAEHWGWAGPTPLSPTPGVRSPSPSQNDFSGSLAISFGASIHSGLRLPIRRLTGSWLQHMNVRLRQVATSSHEPCGPDCEASGQCQCHRHALDEADREVAPAGGVEVVELLDLEFLESELDRGFGTVLRHNGSSHSGQGTSPQRTS